MLQEWDKAERAAAPAFMERSPPARPTRRFCPIPASFRRADLSPRALPPPHGSIEARDEDEIVASARPVPREPRNAVAAGQGGRGARDARVRRHPAGAAVVPPRLDRGRPAGLG